MSFDGQQQNKQAASYPQGMPLINQIYDTSPTPPICSLWGFCQF